MATQKNTQLKCALSDGTTSVINLPAPVNNTLTDMDSGDPIYADAFPKIKEAFATDSGATIDNVTISIVTHTVTNIVDDYSDD